MALETTEIKYDPFYILEWVIKECVPEYAPSRSYQAPTRDEALEALEHIRRMLNDSLR